MLDEREALAPSNPPIMKRTPRTLPSRGRGPRPSRPRLSPPSVLLAGQWVARNVRAHHGSLSPARSLGSDVLEDRVRPFQSIVAVSTNRGLVSFLAGPAYGGRRGHTIRRRPYVARPLPEELR